MEVDAKDCRRSTRVPQPERPEPESEIYILADMLLPAQWRRLDLPRTGWVIGVVAPPREQGSSVPSAPGCSAGAMFDVLRRINEGRRASCARAHACLGRGRRACRLGDLDGLYRGGSAEIITCIEGFWGQRVVQNTCLWVVE